MYNEIFYANKKVYQ